MGALIFSRKPTEEDYRGERFRAHPLSLKNSTEAMVLSQPKLIEGIHRALDELIGLEQADLDLSVVAAVDAENRFIGSP